MSAGTDTLGTGQQLSEQLAQELRRVPALTRVAGQGAGEGRLGAGVQVGAAVGLGVEGRRVPALTRVGWAPEYR
jgi:hypothetical protein